VDVVVLRSGVPASIPGRSLDVGEGGVAAVLAGELQTGESVAVEFQLPNAGHALQTKAVVRHHNQLRCGFEFLGLSRDQRSMIRQWAGSAEPLPSQLRSQVPGSLVSKMSAMEMRRLNGTHGNPHVRRLLWMTLALLLVVGGWAAWQWHRGWRQLEVRAARKDMRAQQPSARVPAEVMERLLIRRVEPVYPDAARRENLQGVVVLDAVIAADGTVVNIRPVSGPDGLTLAAMDAVRWWRFRPYRVRGEPTTVTTTLSVEVRPQSVPAN
jgi:TonB family protein